MKSALRYLGATGAIVLIVGVTASAGVAHGLRTYSTPKTRPFATAVVDPALFGGSEQETAFARSRAAGASYARLMANWRGIAPATRPADFDPTDPASARYSWAGLDSTIENAKAAGLTPIVDIVGSPDWGYDNQPSGVNAGAPDASALGDFAKALARHYDGHTAGVPKVSLYEVWNEPNLSIDLNPASGAVYRTMVNAVADAVHSVDPANLVVAGGLDPFGHPKSKKQQWYSTSPLAFMRSMFCLSKGSHPHPTCADKVHFDVWSHHPYTFGGGFGKAKNHDNVSLGDLPRMRSLLQAAARLHHVVSSHAVKFWVTEFGWDTNPPRQGAASVSLASRWTAESMYQAWHSGVTVFTWFDLMDLGGPGPYQSGLYFHGSSLSQARAKPLLTAFRFPFVAYWHRSTVSVWGRDTTSDRKRVTIQLRHGKNGKWRTVAYVAANSSGIYRATLRLKASKNDWLRAAAPGSGKSLAFSLTVPYAPHIGAWGGVPPPAR